MVGRPRPRLGVGAVVAACGLGAIGLGGCGAASVVDPVARAAVVSNNVSGLRMTMVMRLTAPALSTPIVLNGQGSFRIPDHSGTFSFAMHLPNLPQVAQAVGSDTLRLSEVFTGSTFYIKLPPALAKSTPAGKPWLKVSLARAASATGIPGLSALVNNPASSDPSQYLRYLRASSGGVSKVGTATVDGFSTSHYRAQIRLDRVPNAFPAGSRGQVRQTVAALERIANLRVLPVNVWIDSHQLVRRMQFALQETALGQPIGVSVTVDIPRYGPQPPPALPPADQVAGTSVRSSGAGPFGATAP